MSENDTSRCEECGAPLLGLDCETSRRVSTGFGFRNVEFPEFCDVECEGKHFGEDPVLLASKQTRLFEWDEGLIEEIYGVDHSAPASPSTDAESADTPRIMTDGGRNAMLVTPDHLPKSVGEYELVERSDDRTVWRYQHTAHDGCVYGHDFLVIQQYGGWRGKYRRNVNFTEDRTGGYEFIDKSDSRATFEDRENAEEKVLEALREKAARSWARYIRSEVDRDV